MKHDCRIRIKTKNAGIIHDSIKPELKNRISKRAETKIKKKGDELKINITASDVNALRASVNNILRLVRAGEKTSEKKWQ